ncbi:MAG: InlB B-repeat-containing protein [Lachnospiraceae bacterium]|nr:InlB B-repeat-containing protein [Lachnospiraceae bacterium]
MKKKIFGLFTIMFLVIAFCGMTVFATEISTEASTEEDIATPTYKVTVVYNKNGGKGSMAKSVFLSDATSAKLKGNKFSKKNYTFVGWNTSAKGSGTAYANKADILTLVNGATSNQTLKLYAQWGLKATNIKKLSATGAKISVSWKKTSKAAGYSIEYSTNNKFKASATQTVDVSKKKTSADLPVSVSGKTYYVRMRNYYKNGGNKIYSEYSKVKKVKVPKTQSIENMAKNLYVVSAKINLQGSGSGYHAKLLFTNGSAAVSFGLQYDTACHDASYRSKAAYLCENISNAAVGSGGQAYSWFGAGSTGTDYIVMMTLNRKNGVVDCYIDGAKVGSVTNTALKSDAIYAGIEGVARVNGDVVNATFSEIKFKVGGSKYDSASAPGVNMITNENAGIKVYRKEKSGSKNVKYGNSTYTWPFTISKENIITIKGTLTGVAGDWDSAYTSCSSVIHIPL